MRLNLPNWVSKIDAVMTWHRNKRTYIFAGYYYWRYNNEERKMDPGYPREISSAWRGVPRRVDAAYSSEKEKRTYFVVGDQIYHLDD